jgi:hypothetical protein
MQNILSPQYIGDQYIFTPLIALIMYLCFRGGGGDITQAHPANHPAN